jgi:O-antigen/teichoic acid export membrane protein
MALNALRPLPGLAVVLVVQTIVGLLQMVVLLAAVGPRAWSELAVGQAVGVVGATIVACGLGGFGASVVASMPGPERAPFYWSTVRPRAAMFAAIAPVVFVLVSVLATEERLAASVAAASVLLSALGASWYFVGRATPRPWLALEIAPTAAGTIAGCAVVAVTHVASHFAVLQFLGAVAGVMLANGAVRRELRAVPSVVVPLTVVGFISGHRRLLVAALSGSANAQAPLIVLAAVGSPLLPQFALLDRLTKYVLAGFSPLVQVAQSWIPRDEGDVVGRASTALRWAAGAGAVIAFAFAAIGPSAVQLLSSGQLTVSRDLLIPFAVLLGILIVAQVCALAVLVPLGESRTLAWSTAVGAVVLVGGSVLAAAGIGATAVAWTAVGVEAVILMWQLGAVMGTRRVR